MATSISNKIKEQYPSIQLDKIELFQNEYKERYYYSVESKVNGKDFARNSLVFLLCTLQRSYGLFKGAINSINNLDIIVSYLAARAHMESTGSIAYFLVNLRKYYKKEISLEKIDDYLMKLHLGRKYYDNERVYPIKIDVINVLSLIDAVDKVFFKSIDKKEARKIFRDTYEWLSEFSHPNNFGQTIGLTLSEKKTSINPQHFPKEDEIQHFYFPLHTSCYLLFQMYDECFSLIETNEEMPELIKRSES